MELLLQVKQATNQIVMNCADIDIITASYAPEGDEGKKLSWSGVLVFIHDVFHTVSVVTHSKYRLFLEFTLYCSSWALFTSICQAYILHTMLWMLLDRGWAIIWALGAT